MPGSFWHLFGLSLAVASGVAGVAVVMRVVSWVFGMLAWLGRLLAWIAGR